MADMEMQIKQLLRLRIEILQRGWLTPVDSNQLAVTCRLGRQVWWTWVRWFAIRRLRDLHQEPPDA